MTTATSASEDSITIATKSNRGLKRTCQSEACGARFYDLGRTEIYCPVCSSLFTVPVRAEPAARRSGGGRSSSRWPTRPAVVAEVASEAVAEAGEEAAVEEEVDVEISSNDLVEIEEVDAAEDAAEIVPDDFNPRDGE